MLRLGSLDGSINCLRISSGDNPQDAFILPTHSGRQTVEPPQTYLSALPTSNESIRSFNSLCISLRTTIRSTSGVIPKNLSYGRIYPRLAHSCMHTLTYTLTISVCFLILQEYLHLLLNTPFIQFLTSADLLSKKVDLIDIKRYLYPKSCLLLMMIFKSTLCGSLNLHPNLF